MFARALWHGCLGLVFAFGVGQTVSAQPDSPLFVGMGDSLGESVQSADANAATQPFSYLHLMAWRMGAPFPLPLIRTGLFASVGDTTNRSRIDPSVQSLNLAVSGADVSSILDDRADAAVLSEIDSEIDLVLYPRLGSQVEIAELLRPQYIACWIGANDALGAALSFDTLNAAQLTPLSVFSARFEELAARLDALGARVVFGTIPDISHIAFLLDRYDLVRLFGSDFGLPPTSRTGLPTALLVKLGLLPSSIFSDANFVLDAVEQAAISARIGEFNEVIQSVAASRGMAVAHVNAVYEFFLTTPVNVAGVPITTRFLGGLFSLDGVHPSNLGQAIAANVFIDALNRRYGVSVPFIDDATMAWLFLSDPFIDKDGDGQVMGRFGWGLLETLSLFLGFSGDGNDALAAPPAASSTANTNAALDLYAAKTGRDLRAMSRRDRIESFRELFGVRKRPK